MTTFAVTPDPELGDDAPATEEITFVADATRASIRVRGPLFDAAVDRLAECLELNLSAGRRFLRVSLAAVDVVDRNALDLFAKVHHTLLGRRGTLILTGVGAELQRLLSEAGLDRELFLVGRFADDEIV